MADFIINEEKQINYKTDLQNINKQIRLLPKKYRRGSLFIAQKGVQLSNKKNNIENKFQEIEGIMIDKTLEPKQQLDSKTKKLTINLNNGTSISCDFHTKIIGKSLPHLYKGNDDVLIFDDFISNKLNIIGTDNDDKFLIRNSSDVNIETKNGNDSILIHTGYFININAGKGLNNIKCDNVSKTTINLEKNSQNSVEITQNSPNYNNTIKFPFPEMKQPMKIQNEEEKFFFNVPE